MSFTVSESFSTITARDNGRLPFILRLVSVVLCVGTLISGYFSLHSNFPSSTSLIFTASEFILGWDLVYLVMLLAGVTIPLPITITFDLVAWLFAIIWGILFSIYSVPRLGRLLSAGDDGCMSAPKDCADERRAMKAIVATCVLLWTLTIVHFVLFLRAIVALINKKRSALRGVEISDDAEEQQS